jgi:hypothetical protein
MRNSLCLISILTLFFFSLAAQKEKKEDTEKSSPKTIAEITKDSTGGHPGLFTSYFKDDKLYFEISDSLLNTDILLVTRIAKVPANFSPYINAGSKTGEQIIHWQKMHNKLLLRAISYQNVSEESDPIHLSVAYNNFEPIIEAFEIKAMNADSTSYLIDVTDLFLSDVKALSGLSARLRKEYGARTVDKGRSLIESVKSFPINVEVRHVMTYDASDAPGRDNTETLTMLMNQSFILLPRTPMIPRLYDERVGWFTVGQIDYSSDALKSDAKRYIRRWRLEPSDQAAYERGELVDPIKPIVYYLDPATPIKWRKYFKQGVEDWNECFASAGFKNAIICKDPPSPEEDPDFSPEDARYSVVRYVASTTRNAVGPSVSDPRSGEIIESDIIWYHNHLRSYRNRYLLETGAANPKAQSLDTPEEEIGEMMRRVISHEIGHALGLPHNMKASSAYPVDSLRSGSFTQQYGIATTIMDYARYNYVAQPGDQNIRFVRQLGPYDHYAIEWGYRYLPNIAKAEDERSITRSWIKAKEGDPVYMFGSGFPREDPTAQTESIGDDNMKATDYGLKNLKIVSQNLVKWTVEDQNNYDDLEELYGEMLGVYNRYINHVVTNIGGTIQVLKTGDQPGDVFTPVTANDQLRAMRLIADELIKTPTWLNPSSLKGLIGKEASDDRIANIQKRVLSSILSETTLTNVMAQNEMLADQLLAVMNKTLFAESPDANRRVLQQHVIDAMIRNIEPKAEVSADVRALSRAYLENQTKTLKESKKKSKASILSGHYSDLYAKVMMALGDD